MTAISTTTGISGSLMRYPYVGPRPFEPDDRALFFGRDAEINELLSLVISHRAVLFYSESGAGKSSLVNAGLIPELEREGFEILPTVRVQGLLKDTDSETVANLYIFNTILCLHGDMKKRVDHDLLKNRTLKDFLSEIERPTDATGHRSARVLIFDQFEELFTFYPERWSDRVDFFKQMQDAFDADPLLHVVFTMREDYIAQLDPYTKFLPKNLRTRFRLERLRRDAALEAVTKPLKGTIRQFAPHVDEMLVDELMEIRAETEGGKTVVVKGEFVEPVQLQVVCQTLWRALPPETTTITQEDLKRFGDVDNALSRFYERAIKSTVKVTGVKEGELRRWFEQKLLTPSGTRGTVYRGQTDTAGLDNQAVAELENMHIIRGERRGGASWYELTHDRFIEPIMKSNREWLSQRQSAEDMRRTLETRAAEWAKGGRANELLLGEADLREAQSWIGSKEAADLSQSETMLAFIEASRAAIEEAKHEREVAHAKAQAVEQQRIAESERRRARQLKLALISTLVFATLTGVLSLLTYREMNKANAAVVRANRATEEANTAKNQAYELLEQVQNSNPATATPMPSPTITASLPIPSPIDVKSRPMPSPTIDPTTQSIPSPMPPVTKGGESYAYYGVRSNGVWKDRFFNKKTGDPLGVPQKGDQVKAVKSVFTRAGVIGLKGGSVRQIGTIGMGEDVQVEDVIVSGDHVWIKILRR